MEMKQEKKEKRDCVVVVDEAERGLLAQAKD